MNSHSSRLIFTIRYGKNMKLQVCNLKERTDDVTSDKVEDKGYYNTHSKIIFTARVSKCMTGDITLAQRIYRV
jgi:hypothetical protein